MAKISVGLDIGFSTIKVVSLLQQKPQSKLISLGAIPSPSPGLSSDLDLDLEKVAQALKKLLESSKISQTEVVGALPEAKVFTRVVDDLPYLTDSELPSAIRYASEEFIPMPLVDVNLYWQVLFRSKEQNGKTVVFVVAAPKNIVNKYIKVFELAGLKPKVLETEVIAATRALVGNNPFSPTTMIIQFGATTTDFAVTSKGLILLTRSIATGGMALTRSLAQAFNFEMLQAEEYKKVYGLLSDQLEGRVFQAIRPVINVILDEAQRVIQAYHAKNSQNKIKRVVITGGGAKLPGLVIYLANNLGLEVQEADPWYFISKDKSISAKLLQEGPIFTVAAGLALREDE